MSQETIGEVSLQSVPQYSQDSIYNNAISFDKKNHVHLEQRMLNVNQK